MGKKFKNENVFRSVNGSALIKQVIAGECKVVEILPKLGLTAGERKQVDRFVKYIKDNGWQVGDIILCMSYRIVV